MVGNKVFVKIQNLIHRNIEYSSVCNSNGNFSGKQIIKDNELNVVAMI